ncbi:MAG TPA: ISL3 family transposase [Acetobacteraceae bacterium]|nr:ISL3 family transposase [Acetobacteraceae bacterium]
MSKSLLPLIPACLVVDQILHTPDRITIVTSSRQQSAPCPTCAIVSGRVHSRYQRMLRDLPCQGQPVMLCVQARRFRCLNPACSRQTFAEPLADAAQPFAQRTERLGQLQCHLGLALGGEAGMRLAERLAMPTSADTLLRLVGRADRQADRSPVPRVLAVDDWSWRRGHRYGTILVDLERNAVVDLLPDRQADSLAEWLRQHPGIEVVARDRAGAYADGIRQGAPNAVQVCDRWHLLRNLGDAVQAVVGRHHADIRRVSRHMAEETAALAASVPTAVPEPVKPTAAERRSQASHARRQVRYEEAARLKAIGVPLKRIAAAVGVERKTVRRWLRAGSIPLWHQPRRIGLLGRYADHLNRRWNEGCRNAAQLWRELVALGFTGRPGTVRHWAGQRRKAEPQPNGVSAAPAETNPPPTPRQIARLLMSDDALPVAEQGLVSRLLTQVPSLADCIAAAKRLNQVLRRKSYESLDEVLNSAAGTALKEFVAGLRRDLNAVQAALDLPWTTSPAEGQIGRLKMLTRTMYGRAGFNLLRARVLHAA